MNLVQKYLCVSVFTIQFQVSQNFAIRQKELKVNNDINREHSKVCPEREIFYNFISYILLEKNPNKSIGI